MVAVLHRSHARKGFKTGGWKTQNIAYSNDRRTRLDKYRHNPVLDLNLANFRDPKVVLYTAKMKLV